MSDSGKLVRDFRSPERFDRAYHGSRYIVIALFLMILRLIAAPLIQALLLTSDYSRVTSCIAILLLTVLIAVVSVIGSRLLFKGEDRSSRVKWAQWIAQCCAAMPICLIVVWCCFVFGVATERFRFAWNAMFWIGLTMLVASCSELFFWTMCFHSLKSLSAESHRRSLRIFAAIFYIACLVWSAALISVGVLDLVVSQGWGNNIDLLLSLGGMFGVLYIVHFIVLTISWTAIAVIFRSMGHRMANTVLPIAT